MVIEGEFEEIEDAEAEAELNLSEDDSLPWLESDEEESAGGFDYAQFFGFAVILLALLGAMVGGIYYFSNQAKDNEVAADGSTIEAPEGPYKVKPEDPGGKEFAGTGNVAPAVGEGQTREGVMADRSDGAGDDGAPRPSVDTRKTSEGAGSSGSAASTGSSSVVGVQVGAYGNKAAAERGWATLTASSKALEGVRYRIVKGQADIGTVYRLQALASDRASADSLCNRLKGEGLACQVKP